VSVESPELVRRSRLVLVTTERPRWQAEWNLKEQNQEQIYRDLYILTHVNLDCCQLENYLLPYKALMRQLATA